MKEKIHEIIEGSLALFMQFGIKSLTMDDISQKLGISKKTLYQFVSNKKELVKKGLMLCLEDEKSRMATIISESGNAIDEMIGFTNFVNSRLRDLHTTVLYDLQKYHPESWLLMEDHKRNFVRTTILENTQRGIKEGLYRKNLNSEIIASLYILMMDSMLNIETHFGKNIRLEELHLEMIRYHVRGIANEKGIALLKETLHKKENAHLKID